MREGLLRHSRRRRPEHDDLDRLLAAADLQRAPVGVGGQSARGLRGGDADQQLASRGRGGEPGRRVHHVSESREVVDDAFGSRPADIGIAGVHGRSQRDGTHGRSGRSPGPGQEVERRIDRRRLMVRTRDATEEQPDHLVADELVDEAVVAEDHVRRDPIERVQEGAELARAQPLADRRRPPDIGEQETDRDLGARDAELPELLDAPIADRRIAREPGKPEMFQDRPAGTAERGCAQLAAR